MEMNQTGIKAKCGFKTLRAKDSKVVIRDARPQVEVVFPNISLEAVIAHERFAAFVEAATVDCARSIIQKREREAAEVAANPKYLHDMQAEANLVTLDMVMSEALDRAARNGGTSKEDIAGWWTEVGAPNTRQFYKNRGADDTKAATACATFIGSFQKLHAGKLSPSPEMQKALVVALERLPKHAVSDYLLEKLNSKPVYDEAEELAKIQ